MDFLDCKICHNPYDEENHRPRSAPCGHELCTSCIRGLIKDSTLLCPKCRKVSKVEVPDDLPINFGLIDVIRGFKTMNIPSTKECVSIQSGARNDNLCSIHCKASSHWCLKCQMMICDDCLKSHSTLIGCSTEDMDSMKDKNIKDTDRLLVVFEEDIKYVSAKLQEHTKLAEKHAEEASKLKKVFDEGNAHREKLVEYKKGLNTANSLQAVIEKTKVLTQRKQLLRSWSAMNIRTDTPLGLAKQAFSNKKDVFTEMVIGSEKISAKLTKHEERIYFHTFRKQVVADGSFCMSFEDLKKEIPPCPSLVFLELSVGDVVKGSVLLHLNKDLPNIRENMITIVTGQKGKSLREVKFDGKRNQDIYTTTPLPFSGIPVTVDKCEASTAKRGDLLGYFVGAGYFQHMYWYVSTKPDTFTYKQFHVVGTIVEGLDILLECHTKHSNCVPLVISDCGLVIEPQ